MSPNARRGGEAEHRSLNKLWRSNSIFNIWMYLLFHRVHFFTAAVALPIENIVIRSSRFLFLFFLVLILVVPEMNLFFAFNFFVSRNSLYNLLVPSNLLISSQGQNFVTPTANFWDHLPCLF